VHDERRRRRKKKKRRRIRRRRRRRKRKVTLKIQVGESRMIRNGISEFFSRLCSDSII